MSMLNIRIRAGRKGMARTLGPEPTKLKQRPLERLDRASACVLPQARRSSSSQ